MVLALTAAASLLSRGCLRIIYHYLYAKVKYIYRKHIYLTYIHLKRIYLRHICLTYIYPKVSSGT